VVLASPSLSATLLGGLVYLHHLRADVLLDPSYLHRLAYSGATSGDCRMSACEHLDYERVSQIAM